VTIDSSAPDFRQGPPVERTAWRQWLPTAGELLVVCLLLGSLAWVYDRRIELPLYEPDEAAWLFSTCYYHHYFESFEWGNEDWQDFDALDHPPLAKYLFGFFMDLRGDAYRTLEHKTFWHNIPIDGFRGAYRDMMSRIPPGTLPFVRTWAFLLAALAVAMLYLFVRGRLGPWAAGLAAGLTIWNPVFQEVSTQVLSEPVLLVITVAFVWVTAIWVEGGRWGWLVGATALAALAFLTKLSGGALGLMLGAAVVLRWRAGHPLPRWPVWVGAAATGLALVFLLNPTFLQLGPGAVFTMLDHRLAQVAHQHAIFPKAALTGMGDRLAAGLDSLFFSFSPMVRWSGLPLELMLFLAGLAAIFMRRSWYLVLVLLFLVLVPVLTAPLSWERYYYGAWPFVYVLCAATLSLSGLVKLRPRSEDDP
jgi:hypothetical protein